jgi:hypothetical protein
MPFEQARQASRIRVESRSGDNPSMDIQQAKDEFAVRYYQWAMEDFWREIREGFPLLRRIKGSRVPRLLAIVESLQPEEQFRLAVALVKRVHPRALELLHAPLTTEEKVLVSRLLDLLVIPTPGEMEISRQITVGTISLKVSRKGFAALIKKELQPILGNVTERCGPHEWLYTTPIENWIVYTFIDVGGRHHQLNYEHTIGLPDTPLYTNLVERVSLLRWLGITGQTMWDELTEPELPEAAKTLALLCSHFMQATPKLLEGLVPD